MAPRTEERREMMRMVENAFGLDRKAKGDWDGEKNKRSGLLYAPELGRDSHP
jgi:hypothetical protein